MLTWLLIFTITIGVVAYFRLSQVVWSALLGAVLTSIQLLRLRRHRHPVNSMGALPGGCGAT